MSRPLKEKLDYFPHPATPDNEEFEAFFNGDNINYCIYYKLRELICVKGGYYIAVSDTGSYKDSRLKSIIKDAVINKAVLIKDKLRTTEEEFNSTLEEAFTYNVFNRELFAKFGVLTSREIQEDFIKSVIKRKQIKFIAEFILFDFDFVIANFGTVLKPPTKSIRADNGSLGARILTEEINALLSSDNKKQNRFIKLIHIVTIDGTEYDKPFAFANNDYIIYKAEHPKNKNWDKVYSALELVIDGRNPTNTD